MLLSNSEQLNCPTWSVDNILTLVRRFPLGAVLVLLEVCLVSMSSLKSKPSSSKPVVRPCPQGCGFSLHEKDNHEACPVCLGIFHARRALSHPDECAFCRQLRRATLERRVKFVEKVLGQASATQDPLPSASSCPEADPEDDLELEGGTAASWADQMEELSELELAAPSPEVHPSTPFVAVDEDVFDLGLDEHGLSDDEPDLQAAQCVSPATVGSQGEVDNSFLALYRRAAQRVDVQWPSAAPVQRPTRFSGFFLPQAPATEKLRLPLFPDFVTELTSSWNKPFSTRASVPGYAQFLEHEGAETSGLLNPPPMEPSLAAYLAPSHNHGIVGQSTLPSKHCRFSYGQLEKCYRAQATTARAMSSMSLLQTYQAMCLAELDSLLPAGSPASSLLDEIRVATDYTLRMTRCAALALGRGMATTVVAQRHLWLTLSDMPDRDRVSYLDEPISPAGLFGQSLEAIQSSFELRKKQAEALRSALPRRDAVKPRPPVPFRRQVPSSQPANWKPASASTAPPGSGQAPDTGPRQPAWPRPHPPGPQRGTATRKRKPNSS